MLDVDEYIIIITWYYRAKSKYVYSKQNSSKNVFSFDYIIHRVHQSSSLS